MKFQSPITNHQSPGCAGKARKMRSLTFILISLIYIGSSTSVLAENIRKNSYIRMEETEIIGIIEHPEITYIIPKTRVRFTRVPLERDFTGYAIRYVDPVSLETEVRTRSLFSLRQGAQ